jgi:hypothetical protein
MGDISAANAILTFTIPILFPIPVKLQGFAPDDVFSMDDIELVETSMGVDGLLSGGFVWKEQPMGVSLQADSPSNAFFDNWMGNQKAAQRSYPANGVLSLPSIGMKMIMSVGFLGTYKLPDGKRTLTPRRYRLKWQQVTPFPL